MNETVTHAAGSHSLCTVVPQLLDKIEQFERVIPKAQAVDETLAKTLEAEIAAARAKVDNLVSSFEGKAKAAAPLLEVKTQLYAASGTSTTTLCARTDISSTRLTRQ
jgi:hypothetical protein